MGSAAPRATVTLPGGRVITYLECGDPHGRPVLHHHGGLVSASDILPLDGDARAVGVRLVAFDRPGIAGSTSAPGRTVLDGAGDAAAVLDHMHIDAVRLLGWSMGGPYALASAFGLGDRVERTAIVGGALPLDDPATLDEINAMDRRFTRMADHDAWRLRAAAVALGGLSRFSPSAWAVMAAHGEGGVDEAAVRADRDVLAESAHEATSQRDGVVEEYRAWARPWGFALAAVPSHVDVWQGSEDHLVPAQWPRRLAAALPHADLRLVTGVGHFLLLTHAREVFARLLEDPPGH